MLLPSLCDRVRTLGDFFNEHGRNADLSLTHLVRIQLPVAPWDYHEASIDISAARFKKSDYPPAFLRSLGEARIREHEGEFMVYTDGSKDSEQLRSRLLSTYDLGTDSRRVYSVPGGASGSSHGDTACTYDVRRKDLRCDGLSEQYTGNQELLK